MLKNKLMQLASEMHLPAVTISLNTHRTHPDNAQDRIMLKNLCKEAKQRLTNEFGNNDVESILNTLDSLPEEIDVNHNLDSLHIFLSADTTEIVKSMWPTTPNVHIAETFNIQPLITAFNRSEEYLILLLSQSGVHLFEALNDVITGEVQNDDFPFEENPLYLPTSEQLSDSKAADNLVREYFNHVDKALIAVHNQTEMKCVVICTEDNYSRLMQVANKPGIYHGYANINYNNTATHFIASQAWELIKESQEKQRTEAISEMHEAISQNKVLTDLGEIYRAAKEGRGELLITQEDFKQSAKIIDDYSLELVDKETGPEIIDDITNNIGWEVISKNGRAIFVEDSLGELGNIALKVRY